MHLIEMSAETPYRGETQTSVKVARYRGNSTADLLTREKNAATAAIARTSVLLPRDRENDAATAAICGKYRRCCGEMHVSCSLVFREATNEIDLPVFSTNSTWMPGVYMRRRFGS